MIKSMTGFARENLLDEKLEYELDIRSVNHKYLDINIKLPKTLTYLEDCIKREISSRVKRGKIDVNLLYNNKFEENKQILINEELIKKYINQIKNITNSEVDIMEILKFPDMVEIKIDEDEERNKVNVKKITAKATENLIKMKETEGNHILEDILVRLIEIETEVLKIEKVSQNIINNYASKLENRIKELLKTDSIDQNRIAQEVVIFADKSSIEEEITRMKSHIIQVRNELDNINENPIGKKLDFIIQEMNREVNTIGSKANCLEITKSVITLKSRNRKHKRTNSKY